MTKRIIGVNSNCYHGYSIEEALEGIAAAGFHYVELTATKGWTEHVFPNQSFEKLCAVKDKMDELLPLLEERLLRAGDVKSLARLGYVEDAVRRLEENVNPALALDGLAYYFTKGDSKWQKL